MFAIVVRHVAAHALSRAGSNDAVGRLVGRVLAYLLVVVALFYALSFLDVEVGPLVGALGIGGLVLGLALQDFLANAVSGIVLQVRRPFKAGDQVITNDFQGVVHDVNLRVVRLRTFDGDDVYVPNVLVLQHPIVNWTRTPFRRSRLIVGVAYDTDLARAQEVILGATQAAEGVAEQPAVEVYVDAFDESSINFIVLFWHGARIDQELRARDATAQAIKRGFDEAGIRIPFPQRTVWFGPGRTDLEVSERRRNAP